MALVLDGTTGYTGTGAIAKATSATLATPVLGTVTSGNISACTSTSMVMVTPVLGTPTSGNLANCLGVARAALPAGSILQVVQGTTSTVTTVASMTYTNTTLTATITPYFNTSKIMVMVTQNFWITRSHVNSGGCGIRILRDAAVVFTGPESSSGSESLGMYILATGATAIAQGGYININYLDSPATTSATVYKTQGSVGVTTNGTTVDFQRNEVVDGTSTIILMEVAG
jgi:hypothetical protein